MSSVQSYQLIDSGGFRKLEQVGPYRLVRPAAQAVWPAVHPQAWENADGEFRRFSGGEGRWQWARQPPRQWTARLGDLVMVVKPTDFGHLGIFPEQMANWSRIKRILGSAKLNRRAKFLNLFAYTGGSTLAAALAGAEVVHVDASKTSVAWARENAEANGLAGAPIRWIVEDAVKYVGREVRRGSHYDGVILDPPSFGRGPKGEGWKIEDHLQELLRHVRDVLAEDFMTIILSSHSQGYTPSALENLLKSLQLPRENSEIDSGEMLLIDRNGERPLPAGASACLRCLRT